VGVNHGWMESPNLRRLLEREKSRSAHKVRSVVSRRRCGAVLFLRAMDLVGNLRKGEPGVSFLRWEVPIKHQTPIE